jgi:hypothetical protein
MTEIEIARQYSFQEINEMVLATPRYINQTVCRTVSDGAGGAQRGLLARAGAESRV